MGLCPSVDRLRDRTDRNAIAAQRAEIRLDPECLITRAVDIDELHDGHRAQRRRDVREHRALSQRLRPASPSTVTLPHRLSRTFYRASITMIGRVGASLTP